MGSWKIFPDEVLVVNCDHCNGTGYIILERPKGLRDLVKCEFCRGLGHTKTERYYKNETHTLPL